MNTKKKIRLTIKTIIKVYGIIFLILAVMNLIVSVSVLAATIDSTESNNVTTYVTSKKETVKDTDKDRIQEEPNHHKSTMQLMIEGKEVAKGDYLEEMLKKEKEKEKEKEQANRAKETKKRDISLMAQVIHAEAGICSKMEKYYVATVVENRKEHKDYPNTIEGVIYQKGQFTSVEGNKAWYEEPSKEEYQIAYEVLVEGYRAFRKDAVYFSKKCNYGTVFLKTEYHEYAFKN